MTTLRLVPNVFAAILLSIVLPSVSQAQWEPVNTGIYGSIPNLIAVNGTTLVASTGMGSWSTIGSNVSWAPPGMSISTDNGTTWMVVQFNPIDTLYVNVLAVIDTTIIAGAISDFGEYGPGGVFRSTNYGTTWMAAGLAFSNIRRLIVNGSILAAGINDNGDDGAICCSTNSGTTWTMGSGFTGFGVESLVATGANMFASDRFGNFCRSTDNGATWTTVRSALGHPSYVLIVDGTNVLAQTSVGAMILSLDNGTTWTQVNPVFTTDTTLHIGDGVEVALSTGCVNAQSIPSTTGGTIYECEPAGNTGTIVAGPSADVNGTSGYTFWQVQYSDGITGWSAGSYLTKTGVTPYVFAFSGSNIFAGTSSGISLSTDHGTSWAPVNTGLTNLNARILLASGSNLFAGTDGGVFFSGDNGTTWTLAGTGMTDSYIYSLAVSGSTLFAGTGNGIWKRPLSGALPIQLASFVVRKAGSNSVQIDWETVSEINNYGFYAQASSDKQNWKSLGDLVRGHGTTLAPRKYSLTLPVPSGARWVRLVQVDLDGRSTNYEAQFLEIDSPAEFALEQNFPNPFNPTTTIGYSLSSRSHVTLNVFNPLGQKVATLVDETEDSGHHSARFDGSGLASGAYFYRIVAGTFVATKRLLILR